MNWDSKQRAYSCFPIELDWVLGFTGAVQPNLRAVKCQHALAFRILRDVFIVSPILGVDLPEPVSGINHKNQLFLAKI